MSDNDTGLGESFDSGAAQDDEGKMAGAGAGAGAEGGAEGEAEGEAQWSNFNTFYNNRVSVRKVVVV